jgi:SAM-dependent methyltransferase
MALSDFNLVRTLLTLPAIKALIIQLLTAGFVAFIFQLWMRWTHIPFLNINEIALLQGAIAALWSKKIRLAAWWWLIQFLMPFALLAALSWQLSASVYLWAFLFFVAFYGHTFRTQVPYYPSSKSTWYGVESALPKDRPLYIIDIGSGLGGLVLHLAKRYSDCQVVGVELSWLPWFFSWVRGHLSQSKAHFLRVDYMTLDLSQFDVVFAYLSPAAMPALWHKVRAEMRPGAILLSNEFVVPEHPADITIQTEQMRTPLYAWYI